MTFAMAQMLPTYESRPYTALINMLRAAGAVAIWDAGAGVYSDAGVTPITTDDVPIVQWNDQSGSGFHVAPPTVPPSTDRRAKWRSAVAALNYRPAIQLDGTDDYFVREVAGGIANAAGNLYTIVMVFATDNNATLDYAYTEGGGTTTPTIRFGKNNDALIGVRRDDASALFSITGGSGVGNGAMHVAGLRRLASNDHRLMLDGTQVANSTAAIGTTTITHICIGAFWQTSPTNAANQWGDYLAHVSIYPNDVYAAVRPVLDAWYRPPA